MKLLVFEYSSIYLNTVLFSEGYNMLKSVLSDLDQCPSFELFYLINKSIDNMDLKNFTPIILNNDLIEWLESNCSFFDYCLFIAPEDNLIHYNITKILEKNQVKILGCDSNASYTCSSKFLTYKHTPEDILKINSIKLSCEEATYEKIINIFNKNMFIIKPDDKTSSDYIYKVHNKEEFDKIIEKYKKNNIHFILAQEYIKGTSLSTSCLCNDKHIHFLSVNSQVIVDKNNKIEYHGCQTPIEHPLKNELKKISEKIIRSIPGLNGFVGIDFIIQNDKIYFVEINPRITTPYIVLQKKCKENLTMSLINFLIYDKKVKLNFNDWGTFKK